jgi:hypothetical protein
LTFTLLLSSMKTSKLVRLAQMLEMSVKKSTTHAKDSVRTKSKLGEMGSLRREVVRKFQEHRFSQFPFFLLDVS